MVMLNLIKLALNDRDSFANLISVSCCKKLMIENKEKKEKNKRRERRGEGKEEKKGKKRRRERVIPHT